jgi:prepilin-type N-terminal cleavage/methylation domain-containing protein
MASRAVTARRAQRRGERGFTLIELLITLSVTTIGLIGLLSLHLSIVRGNDGASRAAEAQQITVARMESLRAQRLDDMMATLTNNPNAVPPTAPKTWSATGRNLQPYSVTATVTSLAGASSSLMLIRVVTTWTEDGGTFGVNPTLDHSLALEVIRTTEEKL